MIYIIIIVVVFVFYYIFIFNSLTTARQNVSESWSDIDVQLKRRHDLIPNLINTVKGYATHEQEIFEKIAQIRSQAMNSNPTNMSQKSSVEKELENGVHQLFAVSENYPALKANENFLDLQKQLIETEDEIASARRIYNDNVAMYNTKVSTFPNNLIAKLNNFQKANFFQNQ